MVHFSSDESNSESGDPAGWKAASYSLDPIDVLEPIGDQSSVYRKVALEYMDALNHLDSYMSQSKDPRGSWIGISKLYGLPSTSGLSDLEIARHLGVPRSELLRIQRQFLKSVPGTGLNPLINRRRKSAGGGQVVESRFE